MNVHTISEPVLVEPRLDAKPWGGQRLAEFGVDLGGRSDIGEAVLTSGEAAIRSGTLAGASLRDVMAQNPAGLLGRRGHGIHAASGEFPLLVKLIDAHENLSIQVHPTDALAPPGCVGKTEAWYILDAEPEAVIYAGLNAGVSAADVRGRLEGGESIVPLVRRLGVSAGDVVFLPAGTIHALGAGIVLYEIQQPSQITYRLEDWGRAREMHIEQGMAALDAGSRPQVLRPGIRTPFSRPRPAVECAYFCFEVIQLAPGEHLVATPESGPQVYSCVSGRAELGGGRADVELPAGATAIIFANAGPARLASLHGARVLRGWVPG